MVAPKVFISYSHDDENWKERLLSHLHVLERSGAAEFWDTSLLQPGADWAEEIEKAIRQSDIAVLLISPSFLASDFVVSKELPELLKRQQKENLVVLPILVRPSMWTALPEIAGLQFANDPSEPLSSIGEVKRDKAFATIAQKITGLVEAVAQRSAQSSAPSRLKRPRPSIPASASDGSHFFISHSKEDGDFAELLKLTLEREGHIAWVDTDRLSPGLDWRIEIDQSIKSAKALIAIMSPQARSSEYVTYEWAFAWGCGRKVIPIMLRETTLHPRLATLQYLDFTNRLARPWNRLLEALPRGSNA